MAAKKPKGTPALGQIQLTKNFYLSEFLDSEWASRHGVDNTPNAPTLMENIHQLAEMLEKVRAACGNKGVVISSGYRSPKVNTGIGGAANSEHLTGSAADIRSPAYGSPLHVANAIIDAGIEFGQLIYEGSWVHISLPGEHRGEMLTAQFREGKPTTYTRGIKKLPPVFVPEPEPEPTPAPVITPALAGF
jgi:zinc D-Ala-D-Ala carboxypeptidase